MDSLTKVFNYKKQKDDIDYIVEVIREMAYILIDEDKDFDIVIKLKEIDVISDGCLASHDYIHSYVVVNRSDIIVDSV